MRVWLLNLISITIALLSGIFLFLLKYQVIEKEEELASIHRQILTDRREIHLLKSDWAVLNDPENLRRLVEGQDTLTPIKPTQLLQSAQIETLPQKEDDPAQPQESLP